MARRSLPALAAGVAVVTLASGCATAVHTTTRAGGSTAAPVLTIVTGLQEDLARLGYGPGAVTGVFSPVTVGALERFQASAGVAERGALGPATAGALDARLPSASEAVRALQSALTEVGVFRGTIDGRYGATLLAAVEAFQRQAGVPPDGEYGPQTDAALQRVYAQFDPVPETVPPTTAAPAPTVAATTTTTADLLGPGRTGPEVSQLQLRLASLGYRPGPADGYLSAATTSAVLAFEKREGLPRDGIAGPVVLARLAEPTGAGPRPGLPVPRIEVDIARQIAFVVLSDAIWTLNVSTGSGRTYEDPTTHATDVADTPVGSFRVERTVDGDVQAPLGTLHKPLYFYKGWAVHGAAAVPAYPASHGCVRVSDDDADWLFPIVGVGTAVVIYDTTGKSPTAGQVPAGAAPGY